MESFYSAASWAGSTLFIVAYFLVSRKKIPPDGMVSQTLNLLGAFFVGISVFHVRNWGAFAGNMAWACITLSLIARTIPKPARGRPARTGRFRFRRREAVAVRIRK